MLEQYKLLITESDCEMLNRMRFKTLLKFKPVTGRSEFEVQMNRIAAQEFALKQRHEKASEVYTLFTQLMYNYRKRFYDLDTKEKSPFETHFALERSYDCGGPMRDTVT